MCNLTHDSLFAAGIAKNGAHAIRSRQLRRTEGFRLIGQNMIQNSHPIAVQQRTGFNRSSIERRMPVSECSAHMRAWFAEIGSLLTLKSRCCYHFGVGA